MTVDAEAKPWFLTWRTYGTWLPGDERGWVYRQHNGFGETLLRPDYRLENAARGQMKSRSVVLDARMRDVVHSTISEACEFRGWEVVALNVRTNHIHLVVSAPLPGHDVMTALKARATRALREAGMIGATALWARGGSARILFDDGAFTAALDYVLNRQ